MSMVRNIGFIGFGNMAQAMAEGLIGADAVRPEQICACAKHWEKLKANTEAKGFRPLPIAEDVAREADLVVLAVKPYLIEEVTAPIWNILKEKIVVSVAAGWNFSKYEAIMPAGSRLICTIPNTPVSVGEGIIVCENRHSLTEEDYQAFEELFSSIAVIQPVETSQLSVAGTLSGCGPAFASMFIEALADGAVKHGLPRAAAYRLASQMIAGTGKLQLQTGTHPGAMKDAVCSPGGTTIVGVSVLEEKGFRAAVIDAIDAIESK